MQAILPRVDASTDLPTIRVGSPPNMRGPDRLARDARQLLDRHNLVRMVGNGHKAGTTAMTAARQVARTIPLMLIDKTGTTRLFERTSDRTTSRGRTERIAWELVVVRAPDAIEVQPAGSVGNPPMTFGGNFEMVAELDDGGRAYIIGPGASLMLSEV